MARQINLTSSIRPGEISNPAQTKSKVGKTVNSIEIPVSNQLPTSHRKENDTDDNYDNDDSGVEEDCGIEDNALYERIMGILASGEISSEAVEELSCAAESAFPPYCGSPLRNGLGERERCADDMGVGEVSVGMSTGVRVHEEIRGWDGYSDDNGPSGGLDRAFTASGSQFLDPVEVGYHHMLSSTGIPIPTFSEPDYTHTPVALLPAFELDIPVEMTPEYSFPIVPSTSYTDPATSQQILWQGDFETCSQTSYNVSPVEWNTDQYSTRTFPPINAIQQYHTFHTQSMMAYQPPYDPHLSFSRSMTSSTMYPGTPESGWSTLPPTPALTACTRASTPISRPLSRSSSISNVSRLVGGYTSQSSLASINPAYQATSQYSQSSTSSITYRQDSSPTPFPYPSTGFTSDQSRLHPQLHPQKQKQSQPQPQPKDKSHFCPETGCTRNTRSFGSNADLQRHINMHKGVKPFTCDFKDCSKAYGQKNKLVKHQEREHSIFVGVARVSRVERGGLESMGSQGRLKRSRTSLSRVAVLRSSG